MYKDKRSIKLAENLVFHKQTKHIDFRHHFIRESLKNRQIDVNYVSSKEMGVDFLRNALLSVKHYKCMKILGIEDTKLYFS